MPRLHRTPGSASRRMVSHHSAAGTTHPRLKAPARRSRKEAHHRPSVTGRQTQPSDTGRQSQAISHGPSVTGHQTRAGHLQQVGAGSDADGWGWGTRPALCTLLDTQGLPGSALPRLSLCGPGSTTLHMPCWALTWEPAQAATQRSCHLPFSSCCRPQSQLPHWAQPPARGSEHAT